MAASEPPVPLDPSSPPSERLARSAALAGSATLASRILGLVRETVLAALFGAGNDMDAFIVAFRMPNLVRDLFAEGAMSAAFVPTFTRYLALRGKIEAWRLGNHVLNALLLITGVIVLVSYLAARPLVTAYAGDFSVVPGKLELTIFLTRIMLPFLTLIALAAAIMGMLNSLRYYFLPALAPAAFNVATIACAIALTPLMPALGVPGITAIAIATVVGGLGQVLVQWPSLRREGFRFSPTLDARDPGLREVLLLMGPGTLGLAATQINIFVSTQLAIGEGPGAVSWLQYGFRLIYLPIGLFGVSIATALLPAVARHASRNDMSAVRDSVAHGLALMLTVSIPASVGLWLLAVPIVRLLLEHGHFQAVDTLATAAAVQCYAVGLVGYSAARIASPLFYAIKQTRVAIALSLTSVAVNLIFSLLLIGRLGFRGLALATSLAAIVNGGLALMMLRRRLGRLHGGQLLLTLAKVAAASIVMGLAVEGAQAAIAHVFPGPGLASQSLRLVVGIGSGLMVLTVAARLLRIAEFNEVVDRSVQRVRAQVGRTPVHHDRA